ncbi:Mucin-5B [Myotis davidii]|uniref:Mucin-5B n=1 Tax=Myotis davidii TaxID=225400 RepID=L5MKK3_MYODS|nr:Mucin-5B [Myotis davidii]
MPVSTTASTTASVATSAPGPSEVPGVPTTSQPSAISCLRRYCSWTEWLDGSYPKAGINSGDFDTFQNLRSKGYAFCEQPSQVQCRAERYPDTPLAELGQTVVCSDSVGLLCLNKDQLPPICYNYQIRIQCCEWVDMCRERTTPPGTSRAMRSTPQDTTQTQAPWTSTQRWMASSIHVPPATKTIPSTHTVTPRGTTSCQPQCTWTQWFDVDFPTCSGGLWQCQDLPCPGTCSVQGGSHISTYDEKLYDMHGDCSYVLSKKCADSGFTVLAELRKCGLTDNENCLKTVTLSMDGGDTVIQIQASGGVFMNSIYTQLPVSAGLCGNFNQNQADDFLSLSGVVEGTAAAFANTWKTQAACPNVRNSLEDPCALSVENGPVPTLSTVCVQELCHWSAWYDSGRPEPGMGGGDFETFANLRQRGHQVCPAPAGVECRAQLLPDTPLEQLGQKVECSPRLGLRCLNSEQDPPLCHNYELRVLGQSFL